MSGSRLSGFHKLSRSERLDRVAQVVDLTAQEVETLSSDAQTHGDLAANLVENVIGVMSIPLGVATNLIVDAQDVLVPMATEESSVVAAVCNGAKACRSTGGVKTRSGDPLMIAQIQIMDLPDLEAASHILSGKKSEIAEVCDQSDPMLVELGGGFRDIELRHVGPFLVVHLIVDVRDAMGANAVNTMAETPISPISGSCTLQPYGAHLKSGPMWLKGSSRPITLRPLIHTGPPPTTRGS